MEFLFGDHRLDVDRRELWLGDRRVALAPQVFDLLVYLLCNRERVVTKDDLLEAIWGGRIVSESALTTRINAVRRAVGDSGKAQRLIRTMPRKGFRFVGIVEEAQKPEASISAGPRAAADLLDSTLTLPDKPSVAVLPFANLSGDPEQDYFADGIVEEIVTALSRVRWFLVIARNSTLAYKDKAVDVRDVGRQLGVRYVLEGSLRKSGTRIRVTVQLVEAATANHVWAERYDREIADIFALQDEITERVVGAIEPELYAAEHFRCQRKPPDSLDAWECVIRALSQSQGQGSARVGLAEAEALCRRAIAIAPDYGQAHSLLAWVLLQRVSVSTGDVGVVLPEAMAEARIALSLDERDAWAHMVLGVVLWRMRRGREAERAHRRALELNPNFAVAHAHLALVLAIHGSHKAAAKAATHALRLSPNDLTVGVFASVAMAAAHFAAGRYTEAMAWARNTIERSPEHPPAHFLLIASAAMQGDLPAAAEALGALFRVVPNLSLTWMRQNTAYVGEVGDRLLGGLRRAGLPDEAAESERVLATVLFTDIVDSTRRTAEIGDRGWGLVLDRHDAAIREELARFHGREVKTLGDGFLATFGSPARAVRCAEAILGRMQPLGIAVRAGLHTGEVELRRDEVGGIAVHIAARIAELAGGGEILVSATVRDLVAGSGLGFRDRGSHALKGLPEPLRLYAAG